MRKLIEAFLVLVVLVPWVDARTWRVRVDGTGDAPAIQAAIDSAQAGDDVVLTAGTYTWTNQSASGFAMIQMKASITLHGDSIPDATIVDAEGRGRVILCDNVGNDVIIERLTIRNGWVGVTPLMVQNCTLRIPRRCWPQDGRAGRQEV